MADNLLDNLSNMIDMLNTFAAISIYPKTERNDHFIPLNIHNIWFLLF